MTYISDPAFGTFLAWIAILLICWGIEKVEKKLTSVQASKLTKNILPSHIIPRGKQKRKIEIRMEDESNV